MAINDKEPYWQQDEPSGDLLDILGEVPKRWGRMDYLSRIAVVEVGRVLAGAGLLEMGKLRQPLQAGLIAATCWGSLDTDLAFSRSVLDDPATASPLLFSYTLANISLAEAAGHYRLTGPVYTLHAASSGAACSEAGHWLQSPALSLMIAGELDYYQPATGQPAILANFTLVTDARSI